MVMDISLGKLKLLEKIYISQITTEIIFSFQYWLLPQKKVNYQPGTMRNNIQVTDLVSEFPEEL